jgi:hypothetical protein
VTADAHGATIEERLAALEARLDESLAKLDRVIDLINPRARLAPSPRR